MSVKKRVRDTRFLWSFQVQCRDQWQCTATVKLRFYGIHKRR